MEENKQKILVVDDDVNIRELIGLYLEEEFEVVFATTGLEAIDKFKAENPSLVLLDIMLPQMNGWEVCKVIRSLSNVPIIMVSAKGEEIDKVLGLELGADDYVTKPFSTREMLARVRANIRRNQFISQVIPEQHNILNGSDKRENKTAKIQINTSSRKVYLLGQEIELTSQEFDLLTFFKNHEGQAFSRDQLLDNVWGYDFIGDSRAVDQTIKRLRKKLTLPTGDNFIETVRGVGYKFEVPNDEKNYLS